MEKEQWEIDLRSQIDGVYEYQDMVDFIRPLIKQIRQDTLKKIMVSENEGNWTATDAYIIGKAKALWGIELFGNEIEEESENSEGNKELLPIDRI